jgi:hypothetical protein
MFLSGQEVKRRARTLQEYTMNGSSKGVAVFLFGACAGVLATSLYFHTPSGRSVVPSAAGAAATNAVASGSTIKPATSTTIATADVARGAFLAHARAPIEAPAAQDAGGRSANSRHGLDDSGYSFENELNAGHIHIKQRFDSEVEDGDWAPNAQSTLRASIDALPGRAIAEDMNIECRSTLCSLTIVSDGPPASPDKSDAMMQLNLLMSDLQGDWAAKPPASDVFDDREVSFSIDPATGRMTVEMFVHRKHQGLGPQAHSA